MKWIIIVTIGLLSGAEARNNLFFPGAAHFATAATAESANTLNDAESMEFEYVRYSNMFMACGYAGCGHAVVTNIPPAMRKLLKNELAALLKDADEEAHVAILIYNKDFDFDQYPIGLKFNENHAEEETKLAKRHDAVDDRPDSKELRAYDDKHAKAIRPLDVIHIPKDLTAFMGVEEPIVIDGSKIVFVLIAPETFDADLSGHAERRRGKKMIIIGESIHRVEY